MTNELFQSSNFSPLKRRDERARIPRLAVWSLCFALRYVRFNVPIVTDNPLKNGLGCLSRWWSPCLKVAVCVFEVPHTCILYQNANNTLNISI